MAKAVSKRKIHSCKAVLLLCEHGHLKKNENGVFLPPTNTIRVEYLMPNIYEKMKFIPSSKFTSSAGYIYSHEVIPYESYFKLFQ